MFTFPSTLTVRAAALGCALVVFSAAAVDVRAAALPDCGAVSTALTRAEHRRGAVITRGRQAVRSHTRRFNRGSAIANAKVARAQQLANRAIGTQYEHRAKAHLEKVTNRTAAFAAKSSRQRARIVQRTKRVIHRIDLRIAAIKAAGAKLGCSIG